MRARTLGWAGVEFEHDGVRIAVDPFSDLGPFVTFAGPDLRLLAPEPGLEAVLVTHFHRDHTDPPTIAATGAPLVLGPAGGGGPGVAMAEAELTAIDIAVERVSPGDTRVIGPFTVTAVEAVDGLGDPQVSWIVEAGGRRIFHGGDTVWHGAWWRIAAEHGPLEAAFLPANGARIDFPFMQPAADVPATLTPEQAVAAARALGARELVAIHHGDFGHELYYRPHPDTAGALAAAAGDYPARTGAVGEELSWS